MKKILTILVLVCLATYPIAHELAHAEIHTHSDELGIFTSEGHSHFEHHRDTVESHQEHQENIHKHIDNLCLRSSRQKELDPEILTQLFDPEKIFLYSFYFYDIQKPIQYIQTAYYSNQPFLSSNQPLLI